MRNMIHSLMMDAVANCGPLPPITFFEPTEAFFEYLEREFHSKPIIDVGAGTGRMAKLLSERGWKVLAIDPFERDGREWQVTPLDATSFDYPAQSLPIMARPCHGLWVDYAIRQAMKTVPAMLYVGLAKNYETDLDGLDQDFKLAYEKGTVGQEGEQIVRIDRK